MRAELIAHVDAQLQAGSEEHHSFPLDPDTFVHLGKPEASARFLASARPRFAAWLGVGVYRWAEREVVVLDTDGDHGFVFVLSRATGDVEGAAAFRNGLPGRGLKVAWADPETVLDWAATGKAAV